MDFRPRLRRSIAITLLAIFLVSAGSAPARAAGIGDYAAPFQSLVSTFENVFAQLVALVEPHHTVTVEISPALWHASGKAASAAAFNSILATSQPAASPTIVHIDTSPKASPSVAHAASVVAAPSIAKAPQEQLASYVTKDDLAAQLQAATNALRSLIYQTASNAGTLGEGQYSTGGITNNIALSSVINQLSGVAITGGTITGATVSGLSGLTAADIPALAYLSTSGGSLSGALGIGTTSPSDLFALNGAAYLADIAVPPVTINRLYSNSGNLYWAGNLLGGATTGNWSSDGTNVWRTGGNVGIGTTSPNQALSVQGSGYFSGSLSATSLAALTATTTNLVTTNATSTNLFASLANITSGIFNSLTASVANITGLTATNATTTNLAVSGAARLASYNGLVDIRFYGAVCDGSTNVAPAVTAAINAGARKLFLPANCVYKPSSNRTPVGVEIDGENDYTSIVSVANRATDYLSLGATSTLKDVGIISLTCDRDVNPGNTQKICPVGEVANVSDLPQGLSNWVGQRLWYVAGPQVTGPTGVVSTDIPLIAVDENAAGDGIYAQSEGGAAVRVVTGGNANGILLLNGFAGSPSSANTGLFIKDFTDGTNNQYSEHIQRVGNATSLRMDDTATTTLFTSPYIDIVPSYQTSGNLINVYQTTTPFSGNFINVNAGNSGGTFSGTFFNFTVAGVPKITGDSTGSLTLSGSFAANGTTGTSTIAVGQGFTVGGSQFVLQQASGNVGIGTAHPLSALDIEPAAASAKIRLVPNSGTAFAFDVGGSQLSIHNDANGKENIVMSDSADFIGFNTNTTQQMVINASGQVGIGTTSPQALLGLQGGIGVNSSQLYLAANGNVNVGETTGGRSLSVAGNGIQLNGTVTSAFSLNGNTTTIQSDNGAAQNNFLFDFSNNASNNMTFAGGSSAATIFKQGTTETLRITSGGNVGIGTTSPGSLLALNNIANFTTATSTFYSTGGISLAAGCFAIGGSCIGLGNLSGTLGVLNGGTGSTTLGGLLKGNGTGAISSAVAGTDYQAPLAFTYPLLNSLNSISEAWGTTTANTFVSLQTFTSGFISNSSSTVVGNFTSMGNGTFSGTNGTTSIASGQGFTVGGSQFVLQQASGNVGIGTAHPLSALDIEPAAASAKIRLVPNSGAAFAFDVGGSQLSIHNDANSKENIVMNDAADFIGFNTNTTQQMVINASGQVGIGTTTPYSRLTIWGPDTASSTLAFNIVNNASTTVFAVFDGGNAQLSGTLTQSSDARLKTNIQSLDASTSLAAINSLTPVAYDWLDPNKGGTRQYGFIAQQVQQIFPNLVSTTSATALTPDGTLGLNYIGLIAPLVEAVQQLSSGLTSLQATVAGFAQSFTSQRGNFTNELCVGSTCVTAAQFQAMVAAANPSAGPQVSISVGAPPTISGTTTPPSINIQGANPSMIHVDDTYTDLGAIVHDNQGNTLGYKTFLNDALVSNIIIDTTQVATDTIDYVAMDTWGNTATSTRTVIVQASPSIIPTNEASTTASTTP